MNKSVTKRITISYSRREVGHEQHLNAAGHGGRTVNCFMRDTLGSRARIPKKTYHVTYLLNPEGRLFVKDGGCKVRLADDKSDHGYAVCFLPSHFNGRRVSREVRIKK